MSQTIKGNPVSNGIAIAKVFKLNQVSTRIVRKTGVEPLKEIQKFEEALTASQIEIQQVKTHITQKLGEEEALIFDAHYYMLQDPMLIESVSNKILTLCINAAYAFDLVMEELIEQLGEVKENYLKERVSDLKDIKNRVLKKLLEEPAKITISDIKTPVILVTDDLTPSDTATLDRNLIKGIITKVGGVTSHSAILARKLGIPAIAGISVTKFKNKELIIMDGENGLITTNPNSAEIKLAEAKHLNYQQKMDVYEKLKGLPGLTKDGHKIELAANIGNEDDIVDALNSDAAAIGLFRTEYLYMNSMVLPSEEWQYEAYLKVLQAFSTQKVIIRTLDIGGDKNLIYLPNANELNPFLGNRALRLSLTNLEMFKTQIRALLKANQTSNLHIMLPMVSVLEEILSAKEIIKECENKLIKEGYKLNKYKLGIMIEVPSAALFVDVLAKEVDFFSIGTNDLIQYLFAADRMNQKVAYLYQPFHPVLLKTIKHIIDVAHQNKIWVGVCGEMAGQPYSALLLTGLGIDELSMNPLAIAQIRWYLNQFESKQLKRLAKQAIAAKTNEEVLSLIEKEIP